MRENGHRKNIFDTLTGRNGSGPEVLEEVEPDAVVSAMQDTLNRTALGGMTDRDAQIINGISQHVEGGLFHKIARRRGGSWRLVAALADRVVQLEGLAKIHTTIPIMIENMDLALILKTMDMFQRFQLIEQACAQVSPELAELMAPAFETAKARALRVIEQAPDDFFDDTRRRMGV